MIAVIRGRYKAVYIEGTTFVATVYQILPTEMFHVLFWET